MRTTIRTTTPMVLVLALLSLAPAARAQTRALWPAQAPVSAVLTPAPTHPASPAMTAHVSLTGPASGSHPARLSGRLDPATAAAPAAGASAAASPEPKAECPLLDALSFLVGAAKEVEREARTSGVPLTGSGIRIVQF